MDGPFEKADIEIFCISNISTLHFSYLVVRILYYNSTLNSCEFGFRISEMHLSFLKYTYQQMAYT